MKILYTKSQIRLLVSTLLMIIPFVSFSQGVINNNAKMNITAGTFFNIDNGGYTNNVGGAITNAGTMQVEGDWVNNDNAGVFSASPTTGLVELDGGLQDIGGTEETNFYNFTVKGSDTKTLALSGTLPLSNGVRVVNDLFLDGASLSLSSRTLTFENTSPSAIHGTGKLISETGPANNGYGVLKWNIPGTGNYTIPFGTTAELDVSFGYNVTTAGTPVSGTGNYKTFATYHTNEENSFSGPPTGPYAPSAWSDLPNSVEHLTDDYIQASQYWVVDRFWIIDEGNIGAGPDQEGTNDGGAADNAPGYSSKPEIQYNFKYRNTEIGGANHIVANNLIAQRYNHELDKWGDWLYGAPATVSFPGATAGNVVINIGQTDPGGNPDSWLEDMYPVWTLVDNSDPLPIELVRFAGECASGSIDLKWTTFTETNNDFFTVERSNNGTDFEVVDVIEGAGNSNQPLSYTATDNFPYGGTSYYRLKNTDFSGKSEYSEIIAVTCGTDANDFNFVNAYDVDHTEIVVEFTATDNEDFTIFLYDVSGRIALDYAGVGNEGMNKVRLPSGDLARGIYIINLSNDIKNFSRRVMLH